MMYFCPRRLLKSKQILQILMKCSIMLYFIWVFTVCESTRLGGSRVQRVNKLNNDEHTSKITFYFLLTGTSFTTTNPSCNVTSKPRDSCTGELILNFCITFAHVFMPSTPELDYAEANCFHINQHLVVILFKGVYLSKALTCMKFSLFKQKLLFNQGDGYLWPHCCMNNLYIPHRSLYAPTHNI